MPEIVHGDPVVVRDSKGRSHRKIAVSEVIEGKDFPVVWACNPDEWDSAQEDGRAAEGVPWPARDVSLGVHEGKE
jgi:hypothetical protein